jgi:hypothetical protein
MLERMHERTAGIQGARKVPVDSLDSRTRADIAEHLAYDVPALKKRNYTGEEAYSEIFGLVQQPVVMVGYMNPAVLRKQFGPSRGTSELAVQKYRQMLRDGVEFDPVFVANGRFIDGGHRVEAYLQEGRSQIPVVDIGPLLNMDWEKWLAGDEGYFPFKAGNPGEEPVKVEKSVIRGTLPTEDLESMCYILRDISLSDDEMAGKISEATDYISPEAGSILVRAWRDAGRSEKDWQNPELMDFIRKQLITKMGKTMNKEDRIADKIAFSWDTPAFAASEILKVAKELVSFGTPSKAEVKTFLYKPQGDFFFEQKPDGLYLTLYKNTDTHSIFSSLFHSRFDLEEVRSGMGESVYRITRK